MTPAATDAIGREWERQRRQAAEAARAANRRRDQATNDLLHLFRKWYVDSYRCTDDPDRWLADCPCCLGAPRTVIVQQRGDRVSLRCAAGCTEREILAKLRKILEGPQTHWRTIALDLRAERDELRRRLELAFEVPPLASPTALRVAA